MEKIAKCKSLIATYHEENMAFGGPYNLIAAGTQLMTRIDRLMKKMGHGNVFEFSDEWLGENFVVALLLMISKYSNDGHFPISINEGGFYYYNMTTIEYEMKNQGFDKESIEAFRIICDQLENQGFDNGEVSHYDMIRNYILSIAEKNVKYYEVIQDILIEYKSKLEKYILTYPDLIIKDGKFENYVFYILNDEAEIHAFRRDEDIMLDYNKYSNEARKHLVDCLKGMRKEE